MKSTGYISQGCDPFFFGGFLVEIAPLIAPLFIFAAYSLLLQFAEIIRHACDAVPPGLHRSWFERQQCV
jgi:hypothetical protein